MSARRTPVGKKGAQTSTSFWHRENATRNLQCIPSDDESSQDDMSIYSSSDDEPTPNTKNVYARAKTSLSKLKSPVPSIAYTDDEDTTLLTSAYNKTIKNPLHGSLPYRVNRSAPSLSQQLEQPQKKRHSHGVLPKAKDRSISADNLKQLVRQDDDDEIIGQYLRPTSLAASLPKPLCKQHNQNRMHHSAAQYNKVPMSGMELLMQREQQKAENKRQKPRIDSKNAKIKGLLGKLPEPGMHNINFQQIEQQQQYPSSPAPKQKRPSSKKSNQATHVQQQMYSAGNMYNQQAYFPPPMMFNNQQPPLYPMPYGNMYMMSSYQLPLPRQGSSLSISQMNSKPRSVSISSQQPYRIA